VHWADALHAAVGLANRLQVSSTGWHLQHQVRQHNCKSASKRRDRHQVVTGRCSWYQATLLADNNAVLARHRCCSKAASAAHADSSLQMWLSDRVNRVGSCGEGSTNLGVTLLSSTPLCAHLTCALRPGLARSRRLRHLVLTTAVLHV
jgi:hypothetical protein